MKPKYPRGKKLPNICFSFLGCSACPRNLQYVLDGVIKEFVNVTRDVEKLQHYTLVDAFFGTTTSRIEMADVSICRFLVDETFKTDRAIQCK